MQVLWLRYLTEIEERTKEVPQELLDNPEINKALTVVEESAYSDEQLLGYDKFWDIIRTERTFYNSALRNGYKEGHDAGHEEGRKEGIEEGRKEGIEEGLEKEKRETIKRLKAKGFDIATIAVATGMSEEDVLRCI